jgi:3-methyladenine DNA glycosylase AlkD
MRKYQLEVEREIKKLSDKKNIASNERFNVPRSFGVTSIKLRPRLKQGFSFSHLPEHKQWKIWDFIFQNSNIHEAQMAALRFAESRVNFNGAEQWKILKCWIKKIDNWAHSDVLSKIYSYLLEKETHGILPSFQEWNHSSNPWKRRASVVSTIYYASRRRKAPPFETVITLIKPLLEDKDTYVQKGVGWQLREAYNLWPKETVTFLKLHLFKLPAITFSYATEKLPPSVKRQFISSRKKYRLGRL